MLEKMHFPTSPVLVDNLSWVLKTVPKRAAVIIKTAVNRHICLVCFDFKVYNCPYPAVRFCLMWSFTCLSTVAPWGIRTQ